MAYCESNVTCPMTSRDAKLSRLSHIIISVGSRVIVLVTQFFRVLRAARLQLYALVLGHWSPVINSAAVLSSLYGRRVGGDEVI